MNRLLGLVKTASCCCLFFVFLHLPGCGSPDQGAVTTNLDGGDTTGTPPSSPEQTLIGLINQERNSQGLGSLTQDPDVQAVAQEHANYMASIGQLTALMNGEDFTFRLLKRGLRPGPLGIAAAYLARGYSDPNLLFNAMVAQPGIMNGAFTRIGVGIANPGNGNYWVVLFY